MNIKFTNKMADVAFTQALNDSTVVKNWLENKMLGYCSVENQVTLEIDIDPWSKTELPSFVWAIYSQKIDTYGQLIKEDEYKPLINGGLIYRGEQNYSSHT